MGVFDYIRCKFPLPVAGAGEVIYQTKDTEDRSPANLWEIENPGLAAQARKRKAANK